MRLGSGLAALVLLVACGRISYSSRTDTPPDASAADASMSDATVDAADASTPAPPNFVFVTSTSQAAGALGGLAGADALCQTRASAGGLPGVYRAWLSSSTVNAVDRLSGARGWVTVDGLPVVDTVGDLVAGRIFHPIRLDEFGRDASSLSIQMVTGTAATGNVRDASETCADWTTESGLVGYGTAYSTMDTWTYAAHTGCRNSTRLYCFGIDAVTPVSPTSAAGRRAFVSEDPWLPGGGLTSADAHCQSDAAGAGVSGTFRALLATDAANAASRHPTDRPTWVRVDDVAIADSPSALLNGDILAPINVTARGAYVASAAWTGAATPLLVGTGETCSGWTSSLASEAGRYGHSNTVGPKFFDASSRACNVTLTHLYCLEQ